MPWSPQLGMRVFDPLAAYETGLQASQGLKEGMDLAMRQREQANEDAKMQMLRQEHDQKAKQLLMQQQGLDELTERVKNGESFDKAFLATGNKLFYGDGPKMVEIYRARGEYARQEQAHKDAMEHWRLMSPEGQATAIAQHEENIVDLQKRIQNVPREAPADQAELDAPDYAKIDSLNKQLRIEKSVAETMREKIARPQRETFADKVKLLSDLQQAYDAAVASEDPDLIQSTKTQLDAARAFAPHGQAMTGTKDEPQPEVREVNGVKFVYVPGSKQVHVLPAQANEETFVQKATQSLLRDSQNGQEAVKKARQAWDALQQSQPQKPAAAEPKAAPPKTVLQPGTVIEQKGKKYRFTGGDQKDPKNWVEIK